MLGDEARLEHLPQPQRHVGILGGVFGRLVDRRVLEALLRLAGAGHFVVTDGAVIEPLLRHGIHAVRPAAGIEHIGHQHGVVVRCDLDAVARQHLPVEFQVLPDLEDAAILQQRLERGERVRRRNLARHHLAGEQAGAVAALAVDQRHVAGLVGADCEREAAQLRLHRIEAGGLGVDRDHAGVDGARHPVAQPLQGEHRLVARTIEFRGLGRGDARFGERLRRRPAGRRDRRAGLYRSAAGRRGLRSKAKLALAVRGGRGRLPDCGRRRRAVGLEGFVRLDLGGVGAGELRHPPCQRVEFHRLEEGDEAARVGIMHGEVGERHIERHVRIEGHQRLRQPRLVGVLDQGLAPLLLLDLAGAGEQRFEIAVFADELGRGLDADARHPGHVVGGIADQRLDLDHLVGRDTEFFHHLGGADAAILHLVEHDDAVIDELHQVLVRGHDGGAGAEFAGLAHIGRDQVVGLEAGLLEARQVERAHGVANQPELRNEVAGRVRPMRLVGGIEFVAERMLRFVEHHREMGRPLLRLHVAQQLPQHVAEAVDRIELQAVGLAGQRRQGVIGAEDVGRSVDQEDVVALVRRTRIWRHARNVEGSGRNGNRARELLN